MDTIQQVVSETFSREADRILAALIGTVRDFELAEDSLQDALLVALERWSIDGIPHNPGAWITTTARHRAIDRLRRENTFASKQIVLQALLEHEEQTGEVDMEETLYPRRTAQAHVHLLSPCPCIRSPGRTYITYIGRPFNC